MSQARMKLLRDMVLDAGLELVSTGFRNNRVAVEAKAPNGLTRTFQLSTSSRIDPRGDLNEHSNIKRFARQNPAPGEAPAIEETDMSKKPATHAEKQLTPIEFYRLCELVKKVNAGTVSGIDVFAAGLGNELGLSVSIETAREAMTATGTPEPAEWTQLPDPHVVLARELAAIQEALGQTPSTLFKRYLETLA